MMFMAPYAYEEFRLNTKYMITREFEEKQA